MPKSAHYVAVGLAGMVRIIGTTMISNIMAAGT
jgi:hypothetical protein